MAGVYNDKTVSYSNSAEALCDKLFSSSTGLTGWFTSVSKNENLSTTDYKGIDKRGRNLNIELKNRSNEIHIYNSVMIEPSKFESLIVEPSKIGVYINFFANDYRKLWVCNVTADLKERMKLVKNMLISNENIPPYKDDRYFIPVKEGKYFEINELTGKYERIDL